MIARVHMGKGLKANAKIKPQGDIAITTLPVHKSVEPDGNTILLSCWEGSMADRLRFFFTGRVYLGVWGKKHPPVFLETDTEKFMTTAAKEAWDERKSKIKARRKR